jgi:ABC-2 type transport system permease protein
MNAAVFRLTIRELAGQRRLLLMLLLAAVPFALSLIYSLGDRLRPQDWTAGLMESVVVTVVLPLICLILGTSAIGSEIDDGTVVYVLAKPVPRLQIVTAKFAAAGLLSATLLVATTAISGLIALSGEQSDRIPLGFTLAVAFGSLAYTALFLLLSVVTSRALLFGLGYVFIWEGLVTNLFGTMSYVSIREYCLGIADAVATVDPRTADFKAELTGAEALPLIIAVTLGALYYATRRLETFELSESE